MTIAYSLGIQAALLTLLQVPRAEPRGENLVQLQGAAVPLRRLSKPRNPGVAARSVGLSAVAPPIFGSFGQRNVTLMPSEGRVLMQCDM